MKMGQDGFSTQQLKGAVSVLRLEDSAVAIKNHLASGASITDPATKGFINSAYQNFCRTTGRDPLSQDSANAFGATLGSQLKAVNVSPDDIKKALGAQGLWVPTNLGRV